VVFPSDKDELSCVGWELADHPALQAAREHLQKAGVEFEEGTAEELAERRVQELVRFHDPFDNVFELFHGITYESRPVVTPYAATFVTGDQGMGHVVIPVSDDVEALRFYTDVLGFGHMTDYPSASFVSAGGYHHHIGMNAWESAGASPAPERAAQMVHYEILLPDDDTLSAAVERVQAHGVEITQVDEGWLFRDPSQNAALLRVAQS
jgi:3,4-dihydroxy-9,10-secoandrosta-1,3,5(10)-triene-9,17-dione 4,5-dioxygenase